MKRSGLCGARPGILGLEGAARTAVVGGASRPVPLAAVQPGALPFSRPAPVRFTRTSRPKAVEVNDHTSCSLRRGLLDREAGLAEERITEQGLVPLGIITILIPWPHHLPGGRVDHAGQLHGGELLPSAGRVYT